MSEEQDNQQSNADKPPEWERDLLNRLAFASLNEQRRSRRWNIFFKLLIFAYLFLVMALLYQPGLTADLEKSEKFTALIEIEGAISTTTKANADDVVTGLRDAFADPGTQAVIMRINSPGGSPVQSGYIYDEVMRLRKKHPKIPVYAVLSDICASGGYYIAASAEKIYADKASMVGSIGVLMNGFGFVETLEKLGVERRLYTTGESKGFLDPFTPAKEEEVSFINGLLEGIHQQFIRAVKEGRGDRLKEDPTIFTGLIWSGEEALEKGLVDGLGSASYVARELVKAEDIVDFTFKDDYFDRLADRLGASVATQLGIEMGLGQQPALR